MSTNSSNGSSSGGKDNANYINNLANYINNLNWLMQQYLIDILCVNGSGKQKPAKQQSQQKQGQTKPKSQQQIQKWSDDDSSDDSLTKFYKQRTSKYTQEASQVGGNDSKMIKTNESTRKVVETKVNGATNVISQPANVNAKSEISSNEINKTQSKDQQQQQLNQSSPIKLSNTSINLDKFSINSGINTSKSVDTQINGNFVLNSQLQLQNQNQMEQQQPSQIQPLSTSQYLHEILHVFRQSQMQQLQQQQSQQQLVQQQEQKQLEDQNQKSQQLFLQQQQNQYQQQQQQQQQLQQFYLQQLVQQQIQQQQHRVQMQQPQIGSQSYIQSQLHQQLQLFSQSNSLYKPQQPLNLYNQSQSQQVSQIQQQFNQSSANMMQQQNSIAERTQMLYRQQMSFQRPSGNREVTITNEYNQSNQSDSFKINKERVPLEQMQKQFGLGEDQESFKLNLENQRDQEQQSLSMTSFLFTENKRKEKGINEFNSLQEALEKLNSDSDSNSKPIKPTLQLNSNGSQLKYAQNAEELARGGQMKKQQSQMYISALNTRRNPDLILPGGMFLKGNLYFKQTLEEVEAKQKADQELQDELDLDEQNGVEQQDGLLVEDDGDDAFQKMKNQTTRYFIENNPTIKCRNCLEYGHIARECTNKTKRPNCILCGKDTHDSFSCNEKSCFKCNKIGHLASQCTERNVTRCNRCDLVGHKEARCLKVWKGNYNDSQMSLLRCIQCGSKGHLKCLKEKTSMKIHIDFSMKNNLDEFLDKRRTIEKTDRQRSERFSFDYADQFEEETSKMLDNTNIVVDTKKKLGALKESTFGIPKNHDPKDLYCCYCADRHHEKDCNKNYSTGNLRYQQYERVRSKLNNQALDDQYGGGGGYQRQNTGSNYHVRLAADPRRGGNQYKSYDQDSAVYDQDSQESYEEEYYDQKKKQKQSSTNNKKKHSRKYEDSSDSGSKESRSYSNDSKSYHSDDDSDRVLTSFNKILNKSQSFQVKDRNKIPKGSAKYEADYDEEDEDEDSQGNYIDLSKQDYERARYKNGKQIYYGKKQGGGSGNNYDRSKSREYSHNYQRSQSNKNYGSYGGGNYGGGYQGKQNYNNNNNNYGGNSGYNKASYGSSRYR